MLSCEAFLIQGAPTSPGISNVICKKLDNRLSKLANKHGANYSRYADDITFSGDENNLPNLGIIKKIIATEGFNINWKKVGKYKTGQKQMVTGLLIDNKVRIPNKFKKDIYRHLHFCKNMGHLLILTELVQIRDIGKNGYWEKSYLFTLLNRRKQKK